MRRLLGLVNRTPYANQDSRTPSPSPSPISISDTSGSSSDDHSHYPTPETEDFSLNIKPSTIIRQTSYPISGGSGDVYRCTWNRGAGSEEVAVKSHRFQNLTEAVVYKINKSINREIRIWVIIKHQYILPFLGVVEDFGPFRALVSPWMPNGNMSSYLDRMHATLTETDRLRLLKQITEGLKYLHDENVIHGDLTSNNVLIAADGSPRLADFGISNIVMQSNPEFSYHDGAVRWVAPEFMVVPEEQPIQYGSMSGDIYALGGIMLQVLYGKVPYWWIKDAIHVIAAKYNNVEPINSSIQIHQNHLDFMWRCWSTESEARPSVDDVLTFVSDLQINLSLRDDTLS